MSGKCASRGSATFSGVRPPPSLECRVCGYHSSDLDNLCSHLVTSHLPCAPEADLGVSFSSGPAAAYVGGGERGGAGASR
eukprot:8454280-Pyramimonas_sp.AAC.1